MAKILKIIFFAVFLIASVNSRFYPIQKQCDPQWGAQQYAYTTSSICQKGSCLASISMALAGIGKIQNPGSLNVWLKQNDGYYSELILLKVIEKFGLVFEGRSQNALIKKELDQGKIVICAVAKSNQDHFVLAYGYNGDSILVNDPMSNEKSYKVSDFMEGENIVYRIQQNLHTE